ncbi:MAG: hypothetical protein NWF04_09125 [Candidatus Bathyarchaeota archaeon]|nr:hypothetical protein [Candidatus Bathyarchaeota archaeon]
MNTKRTLFPLVLTMLLVVSTFAATIPTADAHDPPIEVPTWTYATLACPNPIGVNQAAFVLFWSNAVPPTANGQYGDRWTFDVMVTKPDGSTETIPDVVSDPVGGAYAVYTPNQVGSYTFVVVMDDHVITNPNPQPGAPPNAAMGDTYLGGESEPVVLVVQEDPVEAWAETPLPDYYWTRPINNANRNWWPLAGNWLAGAAQNVGPTTQFGYGEAPESAHILWSRPIWTGGLMDARYGAKGYQTYHYEGLHFQPPIILDGKLYYNVLSLPKEGWYCVDLYTGETLYYHNTTGPVTGVGGVFDYSGAITGELLSFAQILDYESPNQHGGFPYLWSMYDPEQPNTWRMYDAFTGNYMCRIENVPQGFSFFGTPAVWGTQVYGKDGSLLHYNLVNLGSPAAPNYYLQCWNTTRAIWYEDTWSSNEYWMWRPTLNATFDGNNGYSLNVTIPDMSGASIRAVREDQFVIAGTSGKNNGSYSQDGWLCALSLEQGNEGTMLWNITFTPPPQVPDIAISGAFSAGAMQGPTVDPEDGVFLFKEAIGLQRWGYSLETGEMLWGPSEPEPSLNYYGMTENIYDGKLLTTGYGGVLICYDLQTGNVLWNYTASQEGWESPYGNYPLGIGLIADGKVFLGSGEHSPTQPLWRGSAIRCIDVETGTELWKCMDFGVSMPSGNGGDNFAIADGHLVALNAYDNKIYCWAKGPSATTVSAPDTVIPEGMPILLQGSVTDESPGAMGTPAISDADQQAWMEYTYMQQSRPSDAQGVPVVLTITDPNGNDHEVQTTSDASGQYSVMWEPPVEGKYTVVASFEGSNSYYGSCAETFFGVGPAGAAAVVSPSVAPSESAPPTSTPSQSDSPSPSVAPPPTSEMPTTTYIAIGIAIAVIVIAAAALVLRKRQ